MDLLSLADPAVRNSVLAALDAYEKCTNDPEDKENCRKAYLEIQAKTRDENRGVRIVSITREERRDV